MSISLATKGIISKPPVSHVDSVVEEINISVSTSEVNIAISVEEIEITVEVE